MLTGHCRLSSKATATSGTCRAGFPTGECKPASAWMKADRLHPLLPRETPPLVEALQGTRRRGARVRTPQERLGTLTAPGPGTRPGSAPCRPDHPREAFLCARGNAPHPTRGVTRAAIPSNALEAHASPHAVADCRPCGIPVQGRGSAPAGSQRTQPPAKDHLSSRRNRQREFR